jgi:ribosome-associated protein
LGKETTQINSSLSRRGCTNGNNHNSLIKYFYLEPLEVLTNRKKKSVARLTRSSKILKSIIKAIQDKKGERIVSLDLRKINEAVADFFIICEANNQPQIRAIADQIEEEVRKQCKEFPYHHEGKQALQWVLIDYVNVVVHIMMPESRKFYKLEEMWSDAVLEEHNG